MTRFSYVVVSLAAAKLSSPWESQWSPPGVGGVKAQQKPQVQSQAQPPDMYGK